MLYLPLYQHYRPRERCSAAINKLRNRLRVHPYLKLCLYLCMYVCKCISFPLPSATGLFTVADYSSHLFPFSTFSHTPKQQTNPCIALPCLALLCYHHHLHLRLPLTFHPSYLSLTLTLPVTLLNVLLPSRPSRPPSSHRAPPPSSTSPVLGFFLPS